MSNDNPLHEKPFSVEITKQSRALCKKCKRKCIQGELRIAKIIPNPLGSGGIKTWHHVDCIFEVFSKQRQTTKRIEGSHDVEGWDLLDHDDKVDILKKIKECNEAFEAKLDKSLKKTKNATNKGKSHLHNVSLNEDSLSVSSDVTVKEDVHKDNCFRTFRTVVVDVFNASNATEKINVFREIFAKGSDGTGFKGNIFLWCKLLLPAVVKRVYPLQTKQLVRIFSRIFNITEEAIKSRLDKEDVGQTVQYFYVENKGVKPAKKSTLTLPEVDEFLEALTHLPKEEAQYNHFKKFIRRCTSNDLKVVIRLIKHDLRMNANAKHIFEGLHPDAYSIFQSCKDIKTVIDRCWGTVEKEKVLEVAETPKPLKKSPKRKISNPEVKAKKIKPDDVKEEDMFSKIKAETEVQAPKTYIAELPEQRTFIPNYFENVKLYLEEGVTERHVEWVHYFIAYGGTVLKRDEHQKATHVLHLKDTVAKTTIPCPNSARHVIVEWIKSTVEKKCLQDCHPYTVRWKPSHNAS